MTGPEQSELIVDIVNNWLGTSQDAKIINRFKPVKQHPHYENDSAYDIDDVKEMVEAAFHQGIMYTIQYKRNKSEKVV